MQTTLVEHELVVLDESGDTRLTWDSEVQDEIDAAKAMWTKMKAKGYLGYSVDRKGEKGKVLDEFDPNAEKIIMSPQMKGG